MGYPNIAVYDGAGEYVGRLVGFPGKDNWLKNVLDSSSVTERLAAARAKAEAVPTAWESVSALLAEIPDRQRDAVEALDRVPQDKRTADFDARRAALAAEAAWADGERPLAWLLQAELAKVKDPKDTEKRTAAFKAVAAKGLENADAWVKAHAGRSAKQDPTALARRGYYLVQLDRKSEAIEVALKLLKEWPDSPQAQGMLRGLR